MNARSYLNQIRYFEADIQSRIEERRNLRSSVELKTTSYNSDKVQEGGAGHFDDKYVKFIEASEIINQKIDDLFDLKLRISNEIDELEKPEHRIILRLRYINLQTFEQIAVRLEYDMRHIHRLHGTALLEFDKIILNSDAKNDKM